MGGFSSSLLSQTVSPRPTHVRDLLFSHSVHNPFDSFKTYRSFHLPCPPLPQSNFSNHSPWSKRRLLSFGCFSKVGRLLFCRKHEIFLGLPTPDRSSILDPSPTLRPSGLSSDCGTRSVSVTTGTAKGPKGDRCPVQARGGAPGSPRGEGDHRRETETKPLRGGGKTNLHSWVYEVGGDRLGSTRGS